jgi:hypothetical protein
LTHGIRHRIKVEAFPHCLFADHGLRIFPGVYFTDSSSASWRGRPTVLASAEADAEIGPQRLDSISNAPSLHR